MGAEEEIQGIHVVYTKEAETADNYIEKAIRRIARERDSRVRVATSDALEQIIILGGGAIRVSAREFHQEVEAAQGEIAAILEKNRPRPGGNAAVGAALRAAMEEKESRQSGQGREKGPSAGASAPAPRDSGSGNRGHA